MSGPTAPRGTRRAPLPSPAAWTSWSGGRGNAEREELLRLRPALDGHEVMARLGIPPGPLVGEALDFLMEVRLDEGEISKEEALGRLDEWFARRK